MLTNKHFLAFHQLMRYWNRTRLEPAYFYCEPCKSSSSPFQNLIHILQHPELVQCYIPKHGITEAVKYRNNLIISLHSMIPRMVATDISLFPIPSEKPVSPMPSISGGKRIPITFLWHRIVQR